MVPAGLLTVIYLTRTFGPAGYGFFTLGATLTAWLSWSGTALFTQASIKLVGSTEDWRPIGTAVVQFALLVGLGLAFGLVLLAPWIAILLGDPALSGFLRLFALELPLLILASAHQSILIGLGQVRKQALTNSLRWPTRLLLIVVLVELGFGLAGAVVGSILAASVELAAARWCIRPPLWSRRRPPYRLLRSEATPLFFSSMTRQMFGRVDLYALQALTASTATAGLYAAAQSLTIVPSLFSGSFSPILLGSLSRLRRDGRQHLARRLSGEAERGMLLLLPFAGLTAGAADEVVHLVLGPRFAAAGPLLALLIFQALAQSIMVVNAAILAAADRAVLALFLALPLVPLMLIGFLVSIPTFGATGAALTVLICTLAGVLAGWLAVRRVWGAPLPLLTLAKSGLVCGAAYAVARWWPTPDLLVLVKLAVLAGAIGLALLLLGELGRRELELARSLLPRPLARRRPASPELDPG